MKRNLFPFEFIIDGPPVSQQARRRDRLRLWKAIVRHEAEKEWPAGEPPFDGVAVLKVTYFYDAVSVDVDNIVKPIQDALVGLVYIDDSQVSDMICRKRNLYGNYKKISPILAGGFNRGNDFLHVRIENAPDQEELD